MYKTTSEIRLPPPSLQIEHPYIYLPKLNRLRDYFDLESMGELGDIMAVSTTQLWRSIQVSLWIWESEKVSEPNNYAKYRKGGCVDVKCGWVRLATCLHLSSWQKEMQCVQKRLYFYANPVANAYPAQWILTSISYHDCHCPTAVNLSHCCPIWSGLVVAEARFLQHSRQNLEVAAWSPPCWRASLWIMGMGESCNKQAE